MDHGNEAKVWYSGMPTMNGLKRALEKVDAGPGGSNMAFWTSLREVSETGTQQNFWSIFVRNR